MEVEIEIEIEIESFPWHKSRWLVVSSAMMIAPLYIHQYVNYNTLFIFITSAISINYWRRPVYGWRRTMDIITANIAGIIMFINGIIYIRYTPYVMISACGLLILMYSFYLSCVYYAVKRQSWWKYHLLFHTIAICELYILLDSINDHNKNKFGMTIQSEPITFKSVICSPFIKMP